MAVDLNIPGTNEAVLQSALGAYTEEAITTARKLSGTGIVSINPSIDDKTETYTGQLRWHKPLDAKINTASLTDPTAGDTTDGASEYLQYIKAVRTTGHKHINMREVITQEDGLARFARHLAEIQAQDEHNAILSVLKGVAIAEVVAGAGGPSGSPGLGGQTFENDPTSKRHGFYVDLGANKLIKDASASSQGATRAEQLLQAMGMGFKDYEPEYAYLIASPEVLASLRAANLVNTTVIEDGNVKLETIFNGKLRLIQTRANQSFTANQLTKLNTGAGVDIVGTKTSFIVKPGAIATKSLTLPIPIELGTNADAYKGGGTRTLWYRWGYVLAPAGYDWGGSKVEFATDKAYMQAIEGGTPKDVTALTDGLADVTGVWQRKATSALSLGILPVFHS